MSFRNKKRVRKVSLSRQIIIASVAVAFLLVQLVSFNSVQAMVDGASSTVFINEFHYDNAGADAGEFIEIAGPAGTDLTDYSIVLYNGSNGTVYDTANLSGTITDQQNGYGTVSVAIAGIQNGAPDGIALVGPGNILIQFLCYEGTFTGVGGVADGQTCTDVGVSEPGTTAIGDSLQLSGSGTTAGDFIWTAPAPNTSGQPNTGQTFGGGGTVSSNIIINEVDSDTPGSDAAEFVELYDGGTGNTSLDGLVLVFFNGNGDASYSAFDLDGFSTDANGYFVAGNSGVNGVSITFGGNGLQNGTDAVALFVGNDADFPNDTPVTTNGLIDAIVYDTNDSDDAGLLPLLNPGEPQVNEGGAGDKDNHSNQRCPNGAGGARNTAGYLQNDSTPGAENNCPPPPDPPVLAKINEIQGSGSVSPLVDKDVITTGVVTAIKSNGFFIQEPDATVDSNPDTSEGILVFTNNAPTVAVGDNVTVTGTVAEFFTLTEINADNSNVVVNSSGDPLPTPIVLTSAILDPNGTPDQLEKFEGMRLTTPSLRSVAPTNRFGETYTVLDGVARPFREPGIGVSDPIPPDPTTMVPDTNIPRWDENPERIIIDSDGLAGSTRVTVTSNVTLSAVTGPLDFNFGDYKLLPESTPTTSANMSAVPVRLPNAGEFTVASFNIENFRNNETQRKKAALAIRTVMNLPDIIGVIEIFDLPALEALAAQINSDVTANGGTDPLYEARLVPAPQGSSQNVGFLVKTSRIGIDNVTQEEAGATFIDPRDQSIDRLHDRPPLVLEATVEPNGGDPRSVIVVVNHLRSLISIETSTFARAKRRFQAESTAQLLQDLQTDNPNTPVISVGDYNSFQFNDGYVDPISVIKGMPRPDDEIVVDDSPDLVNPDFVNLTDELPADQKYTFIFEGTPQALDHVIVNDAAYSILEGYEVARSNADFPEAAPFEDDTRPEVNSDHDMPVAYFKFPKRATTTSVDDVTVTYDSSGQSITLTADVTAPVNTVNEGTVTFTVTTPDGLTTIGTTAPANVSNGTATADFFLPGSVTPQELKINAEFSGGDTTLPSEAMGTLVIKYAVCILYDTDKATKSGSTYPIKLNLCDASGATLSSSDITVTAIGVSPVSDPGTQIAVQAAGNSNPGNNFRFAGGRYIYNLKTTGLASGVYNLLFTAGDDPTVHTAEFRVK